MDFDEFESKEQKDFEIFMMRYKPQYRDFSKIGDFTYSNELTSIAYDAYLAGQQSKQAEIDALKDCITNLVKQKNKANAKLDNIQEIVELKTSGSFTSVLRKIDAISEELLK